MEKYVRVSYPESQEWLADEYEDDVILAWNDDVTYVFVPEELYNRVKGE